MLSNSLIRASAMTGVPQTIRELGGDPAPLLASYHLREEMIGNPKQMMPYVSLIQLLEQAARDLHCPDFGLRAGLNQSMSVLGPIAVIAQNSSSVEEALRHIIKYIGYHSPAVYLMLDPVSAGGRRGLHFDIALTQAQARAQTVELSLVLATQVLKVLAGATCDPTEVRFRHPRLSPAVRYRGIFHCPVRFQAASNTLFISEKDLAKPIDQCDPGLRQTMEDFVAQKIHQHTKSLSDNVRTLVISLLPLEQRCTIGVIARHLAVSERTLQRGLKKEHIVFEELVDDVRRELAEDYLKERSMTMSQIAGLLGYGQQSSFNRACLRWFGHAPKAYREAKANDPTRE